MGVVPVLTLSDAADAGPIAGALGAGGLQAIEVTLRTEAGLEAIRVLGGLQGPTLVGAGSVRDLAEAHAAVEAGAEFLVSPGLDDDVVRFAIARGVTIIPGIATASELMRARSLGVDVVKLFPAETSGGAATVAALAAVFPDVRFVPTGGITPANAADYLRLPAVAAVGGSWMVPGSAIEDRDWSTITSLAGKARDLVEASR